MKCVDKSVIPRKAGENTTVAQFIVHARNVGWVKRKVKPCYL